MKGIINLREQFGLKLRIEHEDPYLGQHGPMEPTPVTRERGGLAPGRDSGRLRCAGADERFEAWLVARARGGFASMGAAGFVETSLCPYSWWKCKQLFPRFVNEASCIPARCTVYYTHVPFCRLLDMVGALTASEPSFMDGEDGYETRGNGTTLPLSKTGWRVPRSFATDHRQADQGWEASSGSDWPQSHG